MRLLQYSESGDLSTHSFDDDAIPPYAILSHTWGADNLRKVGLTIELQTEHDRHGFRTAVRQLVALPSLVLGHKERPATRRIGT